MTSCQRSVLGKRLALCLAAMLLALPSSGLARADALADGAADVQPADDDFALLGEFRGAIAEGKSRPRLVGLQVRPVGGGRFEAAEYSGGLPGESPKVSKPVQLIGKRSGDFLVLSGGGWAILVHPDHCWVVDREGNRLGSLERIQRQSPTLGAPPPPEAVVLFDGTGTDQFLNGRMTEDGLLMQGADVLPMFHDFTLHLEFMLPYQPGDSGQGRGNSGVYLQSSYEVQILDSFGLEAASNDCGGLYKFRAPDVNMCLPPLVWQSYDIIFTAPRWAADGRKLKNAKITLWHNGVKIHNNVELPDKTGAGKPEEPLLLPIRLQDHKNPVHFRNIWLVDRGALPVRGFPVYPKAEEKAKKPADKAAPKQAEAKSPARRPAKAKPAEGKPADEKAAEGKAAGDKAAGEK